MQCPSCGATTNNSEICIECGHATELLASDAQPIVSQPNQHTRKSTLIEFPGVSRTSVPEWRKELSVRVREVQERRARESAREAAEAERQQAEAVPCPPQLELLPQTEAPAINPLVAAALKRIERANQSAPPEGFHHGHGKAATAIAYAPSLEVHEAVPDINETAPSVATQLSLASPSTSEIEPLETKPEKAHSLVVVPPVETTEVKVDPPRTPKRLIVDDPNDPALNYLDSIARTVRVDEVTNNRASAFRRLMCGLFDLLTCVLIASPIGLALYWKGVHLTGIRPLAILIGAAVVFTFLYFTLSIGMTGRTWAMRIFSMRVIDIRTGLIPTGRQSAGRAFFYLISMAIAGLGILYALISREGETMHDRLTRTAVIKV